MMRHAATGAERMRLTAENLSAKRGGRLIFKDVSFSLGSSESLILTGANGSGKSTLLRTVAGLLPPEQGSVTWSSAQTEHGLRVAEACHYLGHRNAMKSELTVGENLFFWRDSVRSSSTGAALPIVDALEAVGLGSTGHLPFGFGEGQDENRLPPMVAVNERLGFRPVLRMGELHKALETQRDPATRG